MSFPMKIIVMVIQYIYIYIYIYICIYVIISAVKRLIVPKIKDFV